mmetsp:Transcript_1121/g.2863  ORF Transcript_1121/g.2863 Transcript_1121/m.2863 type:complete len:337 (+) Transcript_1121:1303-2313(+)
MAAGPQAPELVPELCREPVGVLANIAVVLGPLPAGPEVRVHAGQGGGARTSHQLEQPPLGGGGLRMTGEVGDHGVLAAVVLARLCLAWLDAHRVHAVEHAVDRKDLAFVVVIDQGLVKDLFPPALRDHQEHRLKHLEVRLEDHHPAVVLVLAAVLSHGDVVNGGQLQFGHQVIDAVPKNVCVRVHEQHPLKGQAESINLLETIMPTPQKLLLAAFPAILLVPVRYSDQLPPSVSKEALVLRVHAINDHGHPDVFRQVLLDGHAQHHRPIEVFRVLPACKCDDGRVVMRILYTPHGEYERHVFNPPWRKAAGHTALSTDSKALADIDDAHQRKHQKP